MIDETKLKAPDDQTPAPERGDLANPAKVKRRETLDKLEARQNLEDTAWILSTEQGRRFYWRILNRCGLFKTSFTGNNSTFFNEGERNIGLLMLNDMNQAMPEAYQMMVAEDRVRREKKG